MKKKMGMIMGRGNKGVICVHMYKLEYILI